MFPTILTTDQIEIIRKEASEAEIRRSITQPVLALLYEQKWLQIMEPTTCNGLQWPLPKIVHLLEELAYADGNTGWCVNLGAGANLFSGYLEEQTAQSVFSSSKVWCAGSGATSGKARPVKGGWQLSGKWKYASGSAHATHFTANALLLDDKGDAVLSNGKAVFRSFIFPAAQVEILDTWHTTGLKATSSNDFQVNEILVAEEQTFTLLHPSSFAQAPIFQFPFDTLAVVNMACMLTGMGLHFFELFENLMENKKPMHSLTRLREINIVQNEYQICKKGFATSREEFYQALETVWKYYENGEQAPDARLHQLAQKAIAGANSAKFLVTQLFPFCGMNIIYENSDLNKVWRDISVAGQHYLLSPIMKA